METDYEKLIETVKWRLKNRFINIAQLRYIINLYKDKEDDTDKIIDALCDLGVIDDRMYPFRRIRRDKEYYSEWPVCLKQVGQENE